jgi:hypothetical protein
MIIQRPIMSNQRPIPFRGEKPGPLFPKQEEPWPFAPEKPAREGIPWWDCLWSTSMLFGVALIAETWLTGRLDGSSNLERALMGLGSVVGMVAGYGARAFNTRVQTLPWSSKSDRDPDPPPPSPKPTPEQVSEFKTWVETGTVDSLQQAVNKLQDLSLPGKHLNAINTFRTAADSELKKGALKNAQTYLKNILTRLQEPQ